MFAAGPMCINVHGFAFGGMFTLFCLLYACQLIADQNFPNA